VVPLPDYQPTLNAYTLPKQVTSTAAVKWLTISGTEDHAEDLNVLLASTEGNSTSPNYIAWCLCRTCLPSLNHSFAACKAWGKLLTQPQRH